MAKKDSNKAANQAREKPWQQLQYVKGIKKVLHDAFLKSKLDINDLQGRLEDCYRININRGTLEKLFDVDDRNMDYACLLSVCTFFGIDMNKLLSMKVQPDELEPFNGIGKILGYGKSEMDHQNRMEDMNEAIKHPFIESVAHVYDRFPVLRDSGYTGKYVGYIMPPTSGDRENEKIVRFDLTLEKDSKNVMNATVVRETSNKRRRKNELLVYKGVPLFSKAHKVVLMFLTDEASKGDFYFLSFGFEQYRTAEGLVFRKGLAITGEAFGRSTLVAQNFLVFEHEPNDCDKKYLRGLLKAPESEMCVPIEDTEKLVATYPEVKKFVDAMGDELTRKKKEVYVIDEDNIISLKLHGITEEEKLKALLLLKAASSVGEKHYYRAQGTYSRFGKEYLMQLATDEPENEQ